jgi:hypothetical protein
MLVPSEAGLRRAGRDRPARRQPKVQRVGPKALTDPPVAPLRLSFSPALAEIVGDGRPWTVLMISLLSIP